MGTITQTLQFGKGYTGKAGNKAWLKEWRRKFNV
jgi:hypothetical protein